jgi:glycosyltransferase involved in cell wall biosynthesis
MPKIVGIIPVYNSADVILDALKSIDGKVDEILCFDGRWEGYVGANHSTDETQKIILEFSMHSKSSVYYIALPVLHQHEARTAMLKYLENGDWAIQIDSDEKVIEWGDGVRDMLTNSDAKTFRVCWTMFKTCAAMPVTYRCVKKTEYLRVSTNHRQLFDDQGELDIRHAPIIHIVIDHQPNSEQKKMRKQADAYKNWLLEYENTH